MAEQPNPFAKVMQSKSNLELVEIVYKFILDYEQEAVDAAAAEIERRKLTEDQLEALINDLEERDDAIRAKANLPLEWHLRIGSMLIPGIFDFLFLSWLDGSGYDRKQREARRWALYGVGMYLGAAFLLKAVG